jgi:cellobiose-specific phosphotransferase system component IIA
MSITATFLPTGSASACSFACSYFMELLVNAGSARSSALTALQQARKGDFAAAEQAMADSHEFVKHAHKIQTQLIGLDAP